ncbi:non-ribosomal peptide synthetase [Paenibacillus illinoisensis]|uniref:non-ribosomal peptide synthetase n=1 Tax=Paenibacillus illinoisensis TaxID=59845 RepID=UPI003016B7FF
MKNLRKDIVDQKRILKLDQEEIEGQYRNLICFEISGDCNTDLLKENIQKFVYTNFNEKSLTYRAVDETNLLIKVVNHPDKETLEFVLEKETNAVHNEKDVGIRVVIIESLKKTCIFSFPSIIPQINFEMIITELIDGPSSYSNKLNDNHLIYDAAKDPDKKKDSTDILTQELIGYFLKKLEGEKAAVYPNILTAMLQNKAIEAPNHVALVYKSTILTYKELDEKVNIFANHLINQKKIKKGDIVSICMERSIELIISILAVIKSGAAYVPLDPQYPKERITYICDSSGSKFIIFKNRTKSNIYFENTITLYMDEEHCEEGALREAPSVDLEPEDLAYVIYTSGSTGRPKGVKISHKALCNYTHWFNKRFSLNEQSVMLQRSPISFDASVAEIFPALTAGAKLVLIEDEKQADIDYLLDLCSKEGVTDMLLTPSMLQTMINSNKLNVFPVKRFLSGGEKLSISLQKQFHEQSTGKLFNCYGPTEATIYTTTHECIKGDFSNNIGRPLNNVHLLVLDNHSKLVPPGSKGELYIGGYGLSNGYLDEVLNRSFFIENPYKRGELLYKTGDIVRYDMDGTIEYIDRKDRQIKLRGYRIELGEIEAVIKEYEYVNTAAVKLLEEDNAVLVAFIEPYNGANINLNELKNYVERHLPQHMLPNSYCVLDKMPISNNEKIDYGSLKMKAKEYIKVELPKTAIEKRIAPIWEEVLKTNIVSIDENFFELGGHSLIATQIISRIRNNLGREVSIKQLFENPTIRELSQEIERSILEELNF